MCGICGAIGDHTKPDRTAMLAALTHRGPDSGGAFESGPAGNGVWFGQRRLAIIDLSPGGHQPMSTPDGRFTITFNGEIYNFQDLRARLEGLGHQFRSRSDTEVILEAWRQWGPSALDHLRGMFAFALWDEAEKTAWLARDRLGEKPLYYKQVNGTLLFASEVRSLLASSVVDRRIDSDGLDAYLTFGSVADPYTLIEGVRSVPAGSWLRFFKSEIAIRPYWSMASISEESPNGVPRSAKVGKVAELLRESCRLCSVSDVPIAVLLSGGIDSSSNVAVLSEQGRQLDTFSVVFGNDPALNEDRWAALVATKFQTRHHRIDVSGEDAHGWVMEAVRAMDQPTHDGVNTYFVSRAIASAGIKVAISGQGADEVFLGYWQRDRFPKLLSLAGLPGRWLRRPLMSAAALVPALHDTGYEKLLQTVSADQPLAAAYLAEHSIYSQAALERLRGERRPPQSRFVFDQGGSTPLGKLSRLELANYLRNTLLRDADQMSMSQSIELRVPFLDYRLVEAVLAMPPSMKTEPGRQKPLLTDAVGPALPPEIVQRPKQGFQLPYSRWIREGLSLADLTPAGIGLDHAELQRVSQRFAQGQNPSRLWTLQVLSAWTAQHRVYAT